MAADALKTTNINFEPGHSHTFWELCEWQKNGEDIILKNQQRFE